MFYPWNLKLFVLFMAQERQLKNIQFDRYKTALNYMELMKIFSHQLLSITFSLFTIFINFNLKISYIKIKQKQINSIY